ncbi:3881_t:CDS:2, partial [Rhizophagus irregularis]
IKDKDGKTVTATGNFTRIDNGEPELMLCLAYIIPTFSKASEVEDLLKEDQDQASTNSSSPNSEEDLKKSV